MVAQATTTDLGRVLVVKALPKSSASTMSLDHCLGSKSERSTAWPVPTARRTTSSTVTDVSLATVPCAVQLATLKPNPAYVWTARALPTLAHRLRRSEEH